jgi:SAM-dependent methyltransferase
MLHPTDDLASTTTGPEPANPPITLAGARDLVHDPRHAWKLLLPLTPESSVLYIGFEPDGIRTTVAPHVAETRWFGLADVQSLIDERIGSVNTHDLDGPQPFCLPFPDASFDLILLQGLPALRKSSRPTGIQELSFNHAHLRAGQLALLAELHRALKPDGQFFMAVGNRLNFDRPEAQKLHGRRFRRQLATLQRIWTGSSHDHQVQPLLHTQRGYRRLLERAGFRINGYLAARHDRAEASVAQLRPITSPGLRWRLARGLSLGERLGFRSCFAPAYWIIAHHGNRPASSVLHSILERISLALGLQSSESLELESFEVRPKNRVLLRVLVGERRIFVKIPLDATSRKGARRNWRMLMLMQHRHGVTTPIPISHGHVNGLYYFAESQVFDAMLSIDALEVDRLSLSQFEGLHQAINPDLGNERIVTLTDDLFQTLVQRPLDVVLSVVQDLDLARRARKVIKSNLHGLPFRRGIVHGDLSLANVCIGQHGRLGLIDWEVGLLRGLPVLDAMDHLLARYRSRRRHSFAEAVRHFCEDTWPDAEESEFLSRAMVRSGVPPERASDVGILYWLRYVAPHVEDGTIFLADGVRRRILDILAGILAFKLGDNAPNAESSALDVRRSSD